MNSTQWNDRRATPAAAGWDVANGPSKKRPFFLQRVGLVAACAVAFAPWARAAPRGTAAAESAGDPAGMVGDLLAAKAFRSAARKVLPSIVSIESFGGIPADQGRIGGIRRPGDGPTTGLVISSDGYIITSTFNFIRKPPIITVVLQDGTRRVARLLGRDDARKLCLLKVDDVENLPTPQLVPRSQLRVGQWAIAVGVGFGDPNPAISAGIISATSRMMGRAVQTDANTSPANYGGPLVDIQGRVIGICVPLSPQSQQTGSGVQWYDSGIGFAIPLHGADRLLAQLKAGKVVRPGYLGVQVKPRSKGNDGAEVFQVQDDSPAQRAGLKIGDAIVAVDGEKIIDDGHLRIAIGRHIEGDLVRLTIERGAAKKEVPVTLAGTPHRPLPKKPPSAGHPRLPPNRRGP